MRATLDAVYRICGAVAALLTAAIAGLVVAQVAGRIAGVLVPGADDLAGYSLMASSFLALAPTLRAGAHIRVTLLVRHAPPARRRAVELWSLGFSALVMAYLVWHVVEMVWDAFRFGEKSIGQLAVPLWIPQSFMALGIAVLIVALVDEFIRVLVHGVPSYPDDLEAQEVEAAATPAGGR